MTPFLTKLSQFRKRIFKRKNDKKDDGEQLSQDLATIEKETGNITFIRRRDPQALARCHPQSQSPLFALPGELRTMIFAYALTPDAWQDSFDTQLFHPMGRLSPQILQTCRRIWLEANLLIFEHAEPEFFLYGANPFGELTTEEAEGTVRGLVELDFFLRKLTPVTQLLLRLTVNADMEVLSKWTLRTFAVCHNILRVRKVSPQPLISTPSVDSERTRQMVGDMLRFAAGMGTRRFRLQIQALMGQRSELDRAFDGLSAASASGELAPAWRFDRDQCQRPMSDPRPGKDHIDVAVLQWHRRHDQGGGRETRNRDVKDGPESSEAERCAKAKAAYVKKWQEQGSLLVFVPG